MTIHGTYIAAFDPVLMDATRNERAGLPAHLGPCDDLGWDAWLVAAKLAEQKPSEQIRIDWGAFAVKVSKGEIEEHLLARQDTPPAFKTFVATLDPALPNLLVTWEL